MDKKILVFGAGKSATCLIDYLISEAGANEWTITVADNDLALAQSKTNGNPRATAISLNVQDNEQRSRLVETADLVISLLPPALHFLVAKDCVVLNKNLLTASYTDDNMRGLRREVEDKKLLFLCEMGLDPGIDHMSAMQLIHRIQDDGGSISSFISHCGGLVAPENDDNPWHYKISWNPRNVVMAGKAGAMYRLGGKTKQMLYQQLFDETRMTSVPGLDPLAWYPNRDSLEYIDMYQLQDTETFIRTTLRYPQFCAGWKQLVDLQFTSEEIFCDSDGMTLKTFFHQQIERNHHGNLPMTDIFRQQLDWLGLQDDSTYINKGRCSAMDILQFALEKKLSLRPGEKDMVVMLHEIVYRKNTKQYTAKAHLTVKGQDHTRTAMAKTVGLPLGIAAKLILQGTIRETGLHIPVIPSIYKPVLAELEHHGIAFQESFGTI